MIDLSEIKIPIPAASAYFPLNTNDKLHYFDQALLTKVEDNQMAILCVHGNPSWSWFYRHFFTKDQNYRILALDHLGMGLSTTVNRYVSIEEHANNLVKFLDFKKIKKVHLVVQDWGGIVALWALKNSSIKIESIIGMNTAFFSRTNFPWRIYLSTRPWWNSFINKDLGLFSKSASFMTTHNKMSAEVKAGYLYPYVSKEQRQGIVNFLTDIPWFQKSKYFSLVNQCEDYLKQLNIPMMAIWGLRDFCFDESYLLHWKKICPQLQIEKYHDAGHWVIEDKTKDVLALTKNFWSKII